MPTSHTSSTHRPTVRDAFLRLMRELGLDTVFGIRGSTELPMFRDFPEAAGVGHAMGNIFTAFRNQTPLIVTAGQQSRPILPFDPFLSATQATDLPKPYVKWACEPARAEDVPLALLRAWHMAMQPPCGPVFLSIPADGWDRPWLARPPAPDADADPPVRDVRAMETMKDALPDDLAPAPSPCGPAGGLLSTSCMASSVAGGLLFVALVAMSIVSIVGRKLASAPVPGDVEVLQMVAAAASAIRLD